LYKTPNVYYFLQILNGISSARSAHVLFHDADLFLFSKDFLKRHYETFLDRHVSVLGVDRRSIGRLEEYRHIVATWEMIASLAWLMRFKPYEHRGHKRLVRGRLINFDPTLFSQFLTDPREVGINGDSLLDARAAGGVGCATCENFACSSAPFCATGERS
jgi:hypothetical protein